MLSRCCANLVDSPGGNGSKVEKSTVSRVFLSVLKQGPNTAIYQLFANFVRSIARELEIQI